MEGKAHSPLVIHALKQAVHQEVPSMTAVKMPELRRSIRAKDQKDRIAKRANMRKTSSPVQRFAEQTVLESFAVSHSTALDYYKRVLVFQNYCFLLGLSITNATQVDHSLTEFLNQAFFEGLDISEASKFYAAVLEAFPFVGKTGLIRSRRALKGWRNLDPGQSRTPLAWPLVAYIAMALLQLGNPPAALCVLTMFTTYMRPSEALKLRKCDLVVSRHLQVSWALNLNAQEEDNPSKVGLTDETILLDSPLLPYIGPALQKLAAGAQRAPLFGLSYPALHRAWHQALVHIGLEHDFAVLYQLRHSGASWDRLKKLRSILDIKLRGRWSSDSSLKRYESHAKVAQMYEKLPPAVRRQAEGSPPLLKAMVTGSFAL